MGWLSAGYQLYISWPWASYQLVISYLSASYGLAIGLVWAGYGLAILLGTINGLAILTHVCNEPAYLCNVLTGLKGHYVCLQLSMKLIML